MKTLNRKTKRTFTMMELVIVIAIIALLSALAGPSVMSFLENAKATAAESQIQAFDKAANMYKIQKKRFPQSLKELCEVQPDGSSFMDQEVTEDPWGNAYQVTVTAGRFIVTSYGADGTSGGEGVNADISNARKK